MALKNACCRWHLECSSDDKFISPVTTVDQWHFKFIFCPLLTFRYWRPNNFWVKLFVTMHLTKVYIIYWPCTVIIIVICYVYYLYVSTDNLNVHVLLSVFFSSISFRCCSRNPIPCSLLYSWAPQIYTFLEVSRSTFHCGNEENKLGKQLFVDVFHSTLVYQIKESHQINASPY